MDKPEGFEVTEYGKPQELFDKYSVIHQIMQDRERECASAAIHVAFVGSMLKVTYHCYEMHLPTRMRDIETQSNEGLNDAVKYLKKEFKSRRKETLTLKEDKSLANYTVQKVSLNERYYYASWRFFEME